MAFELSEIMKQSTNQVRKIDESYMKMFLAKDFYIFIKKQYFMTMFLIGRIQWKLIAICNSVKVVEYCDIEKTSFEQGFFTFCR